MSACTVIVSGNIKNQEKIDAYRAVAGAVMKKHGVTAAPSTYIVSEVVAGNSKPSFMMEIKFPDKKMALAAFNDPDYKTVISQRDEGFGDLSIFMLG